MVTTIEITDQEAEEFKAFRQHKQQIEAEDVRWKELKRYCKDLQFGNFNLSVKDGMPYKVSKSMQTVIFGIQI